MKTNTALSFLLTIPMLTGCASILDSGEKPVKIDSHPEGAQVTIKNQDGKQLYVETTPVSVSLPRSAGYFKGADYSLHFEKSGFYPYEGHLGSDLDGWYVGNAFFGGLIGMLLVDPMTGDMYVPSTRQIDCNLIPMTSVSTTAATQTNSPAVSH